MPRLEIAKPIDRGVQQLQYVGDGDGTPAGGGGGVTIPWWGLAAIVALVAKGPAVKATAAAAAVYLGSKALRRR